MKNTYILFYTFVITIFLSKNSKRDFPRKFKHSIFAIFLFSLFTPINVNSQWVKVSGGMASNKTVPSVSSNGSVVYATTIDSGIFRSTNNGTNWIHVNDIPIGNSGVVNASGSTLFAGSNGNGIYRSINNGLNWTQENAGLTHFNPANFIVKDQYIFAALSNGAIYRSSDDGIDWFPKSSGASGLNYTGFAVLGNNIFVCAYASGVYKSSNNGENWNFVNTNLPNNPHDLATLGSDIFVGTHVGVYRSTNMGVNWFLATQGVTGIVENLLVIGSNILAGTSTGFFRSTNQGETWTSFNQGLTTTSIYGLTSDNSYIYAGTQGGSVFRRPLSDIIIYTSMNLYLSGLMEGLYNPTTNEMAREQFETIYLRNSFPPYAPIDSAFGSIDPISFSGLFSFNSAPSGTYYIVVKNQNCLETWSKLGGESLVRDNSINFYDLTSASSQAYGDNQTLKGTKYCIYSGDVDQNGSINLSDNLLIYNDAVLFMSGFINSDLTGDELTDLTDLLIASNNASNFVAVIRP